MEDHIRAIGLENILAEANENINWIRETTDKLHFPLTERFRTAAACFAVAQEHHQSIVLLAAHHRFASGFALVRVAFDAHIRGEWLRLCATEQQVSFFVANGELKGTGFLISEIEKNPAYPEPLLSRYKTQEYKLLCDYTHTGGRQIQQWRVTTAIESNYAFDEIMKVIATSQSIALMSLLGIAAMVEDKQAALSIIDKLRTILGWD